MSISINYKQEASEAGFHPNDNQYTLGEKNINDVKLRL